MDQNCDLFFPLPEQKEASKSEIKIVFEIFRRTLNDLPFGNSEQAAKEIFDILYKSNKIQFKDDDRLTLLKEIEQPAIQILSGLQEKIKDVATPIGRSEERAAKLLVATHYELALAYRCLLKKTQTKDLSSGDKAEYANHIRLIIYHIGEILRAKYSVYTNSGGTIWRYIYTLFICAYNYGIHNISLPLTAWCRFKTVEDVFKSILLLSMSSPLTMRGHEFNALYNLAPELTEYIDLGKIKCGEKYSDFMTFNLSGTEPPKKQFATGCDSCSNSSNCFAVSTTNLVNYIDEQQEQIKDEKQLSPIQRVLNSPSKLDGLKRNLAGLERVGGSKRVDGGDLRVEMVAGFSDAYTFLNKGSEDAADNQGETEIVAESDSWETIGEEAITVEDTGDWTTTGIIRAGLRKTTCKVINHSSGGYCLYMDVAERFHLRVGELAIVKESGKHDWQAAVIIWVSGNKKRMDIGVKLLDGTVSTGTFKSTYTNNSDIQLDCMFLAVENVDNESSVRLITATSDFYKGDRLSVVYQGTEHNITITGINAQTNGYAEYICDWSETREDAVVDQALRPEKKETSEMDFESIWDVL